MYRVMYFPVAIFALPLGCVLWLLEKFAEWYGNLLCSYQDWCAKKSGIFIRAENGIWIYNPKYLEEEGDGDESEGKSNRRDS